MAFNLLGAGAGAGEGLQVLLAQLRAQEDDRVKQQQFQQELQQRGRIADQTNQRLIEQGQLQERLRRDALTGSQADRAATQADKALSLYGPGDTIDPATKAQIVGANPATAGLFQETPGAKVTQTQGITALPQSAPSGVGTLAMKAPVMPSEPSTTITDQASPLNAPSVIKFRGTGGQRFQQSKESDAVSAQQAKVDEATQRLQLAWSALSEKSASDQARAGAESARAAAQAETIKALTALREAQSRLADAKAAAVPEQGDPVIGAPILAEDGQGGYVVHSLHKSGKISTQPLPAGQKPTKAAAPGVLDRIKGLFGGSAAPSVPRVLSTDPNAGTPVQ